MYLETYIWKDDAPGREFKEHALETEILLLVLGIFAPGVYLACQRDK